MNLTPSFLERVQEICRNIDQARTLEALYENLPRYLAKIGDATAKAAEAPAFMAIAKHSAGGATFQITNGTGRYATLAGSKVPDGPILEYLHNAVGQRSNYYSADAVTFCFPHPENFAILVYVGLEQEIGADARELLKFVNDKVAGSIRAHTLSKQATRTGRAMVIALASLAEHKDQDTGDHIMRVAIMTDEIVQVLGELGYYPENITPEFECHISTASILHDVGKIAIPDSILKKPGKLDPDERKFVETHTLKGHNVLEKASRILDDHNYLLSLACEVALYHHEHYNGEGYPMQMAGQKIPLSARIVGLVDVFDALTSERAYKKAWSEQEAITYISEQSGRQFDPLVVEAFLKVMEYRKDIVLIRWTEALSVKVPSMDSDHCVLIGLINQLASAEKIGNRRVAESVLDELLNYAIDHFNREEQFLQKSGYPFQDLVKHKLQHAAFTETIQDIRWQYLCGFCPRINQEVLFFLRDWLGKHILVEDMKYAETNDAPKPGERPCPI